MSVSAPGLLRSRVMFLSYGSDVLLGFFIMNIITTTQLSGSSLTSCIMLHYGTCG